MGMLAAAALAGLLILRPLSDAAPEPEGRLSATRGLTIVSSPLARRNARPRGEQTL